MTSAQDAALCRAVARCDANAVVKAAEPICRGAIRGLYADGHDRDDLLQVARMAVSDALERFRGQPDRFPAFASMVARRRVMSEVTTANRVKRRGQAEAYSLQAPLDADGQTLGDLLQGGEDPHDVVVDLAEAREALRRIADDLTEIERVAFVGTQLLGLPYERFGPRKSVDNAVQRVRRKLAA